MKFSCTWLWSYPEHQHLAQPFKHQLRPQQTSLTRNKQWKISKIYPSNEEIWRTSTNKIESLKSPSSKKNKQNLQFHKEEIYKWRFERTILFEVQTKKNHKTIKEEWINGWNRRKKNHIDFIHHFITSKFFTLNPSSGCRKSEKLSEKKVKNTRKIKQNTFRRFIKTGEVLKNSRKMKKDKKTP